MPRFNTRDDASPHKHVGDVTRYRSLVDYLFDHPDASMDFVTFNIRKDCANAAAKLKSEAPLREDGT